MADDRNKIRREDSERLNEPERHEPPHTTKGGVTAPKFGSAGSGGAEYEQVPEQHDEEIDEDDVA